MGTGMRGQGAGKDAWDTGACTHRNSGARASCVCVCVSVLRVTPAEGGVLEVRLCTANQVDKDRLCGGAYFEVFRAGCGWMGRGEVSAYTRESRRVSCSFSRALCE